MNCLLSFCYGLLAKEMLTACLAVGFDPYVGLFHRPRFDRPALALDLAEDFRLLLAGSCVLRSRSRGLLLPVITFTSRPGRTYGPTDWAVRRTPRAPRCPKSCREGLVCGSASWLPAAAGSHRLGRSCSPRTSWSLTAVRVSVLMLTRCRRLIFQSLSRGWSAGADDQSASAEDQDHDDGNVADPSTSRTAGWPGAPSKSTAAARMRPLRWSGGNEPCSSSAASTLSRA
jgi:CRISPR associated protein Cas1